MSVSAHDDRNCNSGTVSDRRYSLKLLVAIDTDVEQHRAGGLFGRVLHPIPKRAGYAVYSGERLLKQDEFNVPRIHDATMSAPKQSAIRRHHFHTEKRRAIGRMVPRCFPAAGQQAATAGTVAVTVSLGYWVPQDEWHLQTWIAYNRFHLQSRV